MLAVTSCLVPFLLLAHFSGANSEYSARQEDSCPADQQQDWSYRGDNGPQYWGQKYPDCNGYNQSPIDIITAEAVQDPNLAPLQMVNYDVPVSTATLLNNGHTAQVKPTDGVERYIEVEGSQYNLDELHFHWGNGSEIGSEHAINGYSYAGELHFVHINGAGRIAVVAVMYQENNTCNAELRKQGYVLKEVQYRGESTELQNFDFSGLLPENPAAYYRYYGSLTTPECTEGVIWSVLKEPQHICHPQMVQLRELHSDTSEENNDACHIDNNHRPTQPLNGRVVTGSQ